MSPTKTATTLGLGAIALILLVNPLGQMYGSQQLYPVIANAPKQTGNSASPIMSLTVNSTHTNASIQIPWNLSGQSVVSISWADAANLSSAIYQVRIMQGDTVIAPIIHDGDDSQWFAGGSVLQLSHRTSFESSAGHYVLMFSLDGKSGNVTITNTFVSSNSVQAFAERISPFVPFLIVVAIIAGLASSAASFSALRQAVERLRTLLGVRG